jgi:hypothetical protein
MAILVNKENDYTPVVEPRRIITEEKKDEKSEIKLTRKRKALRARKN